MSGNYENHLLLDELRMQLRRDQVRIEKLTEDLEERDEEISLLRQDYREAHEANESLEADVEDLSHQLVLAKDEIRLWRKKKKSQVKREVIEENQQLREKLRILKEQYESALNTIYEEKRLEPEEKSESPSAILMDKAQPDQMQELLEHMVQQYESEIHILRTANETTIEGLQVQLEKAIVDKEEIAEIYILEIERLELALTEAVNRLTDVEQKYTKLKLTVVPSSNGVRYRSLNFFLFGWGVGWVVSNYFGLYFSS